MEPPDFDQLRRELENLAQALRADASLRETRFGRAGMPVEVVRGPLKGLWGELLRLEAHSQLLIRVSFLGRSAALRVDEGCVEPLR